MYLDIIKKDRELQVLWMSVQVGHLNKDLRVLLLNMKAMVNH